MNRIFLGSELVEIGIQIEKNGRDFYAALMKQSEKEALKKVFEYLAKAEKEHIAAFEKILGSEQNYQSLENYPQEYFSYMNALAGEYVFTKENAGKDAAGSIESDGEAVDFAIKFEKDSILFYQGMKKAVKEEGLHLIEELIRQEQGHLQQLVDLKKAGV